MNSRSLDSFVIWLLHTHPLVTVFYARAYPDERALLN